MQPPVPDAIRQRLINPMVDYVFKILLGSEQNKPVLLSFLNAILHRTGEARIVELTLLNPYNDKELADDKLTIVDVKARDSSGHVFQVEVQLIAYRSLPERMLYTWTQLYGKQLLTGQDFAALKPVTSIWLVKETVFEHVVAYAHQARMQDPVSGIVLDELSAIHILEVGKWARQGVVADLRDEWLKFFWEGGMTELETLSETLSPEFIQAVEALRPIREREADYWRYQARLDFLRVQATLDREARETRTQLETAQKTIEEKDLALEAERRENALKDQALTEKDQALEAERREKERLQALLRQAGIAVGE